MTIEIHHADCLQWMATQPAGRFSLTLGSPPYENLRTYGIGFDKRGQDWVDWMVVVVRETLRITNGLVAFVVEGKTKGYRWSATPALLLADLHRAGIHLRKPPLYVRDGIPGSGGPDWLKNKYEFIVCCTNGGKLPWSDNTAMGHPPIYGPGGAPSHRKADGSRVNGKLQTRRKPDGTRPRDGIYKPPALANPGNLIDCGPAGGGNIGCDIAHENEAPFPESLAEFFIRSFCPPGGWVYDPFAGSGTTLAVAERCGRNAAGTDVRESQVALTKRRVAEIQRELLP